MLNELIKVSSRVRIDTLVLKLVSDTVVVVVEEVVGDRMSGRNESVLVLVVLSTVKRLVVVVQLVRVVLLVTVAK